MTVREVDTLPQDRLADALGYLADLNDSDAISAEDIRAGRTVTIEEYRRTRGL